MRSEWDQDDDCPRFWRGVALACLLGSAGWLAGVGMTAFVVWRTGRLG